MVGRETNPVAGVALVRATVSSRPTSSLLSWLRQPLQICRVLLAVWQWSLRRALRQFWHLDVARRNLSAQRVHPGFDRLDLGVRERHSTLVNRQIGRASCRE